MTGYFRDDAPLSELMLDEPGRRELDDLWEEFDFITGAPMRQHASFLWFERTDSRFMRDPEFDFARAEDKDAASEAKIRRLAEVYLAKARARRRRRDRAPGDRGPFPDHRREHPPRRAGAARGRAPPRRGPQGVRRAGLPPAAVGAGARRRRRLLPRPRARGRPGPRGRRPRHGRQHPDVAPLLLPGRPAPERGDRASARCRTTPWPAA